MALAGFEFSVPASERPQTHALGRTATGTGQKCYSVVKYCVFLKKAFPKFISREKNRANASEVFALCGHFLTLCLNWFLPRVVRDQLIFAAALAFTTYRVLYSPGSVRKD